MSTNHYPFEDLPRRGLASGRRDDGNWYGDYPVEAETITTGQASTPYGARQLPIRTVPDSEVNGRPTINTAMRRVQTDAAERAAAEEQVRALNGETR